MKATCCGSARRARAPCAIRWPGVMGVPGNKFRVITEEVGGAFGLKTGPYPEYIAMLVGAKKIGRPVHWMSGRTNPSSATITLVTPTARSSWRWMSKANSRRSACAMIGSLGAYVGAVGANIHTANMTRCLPGMYDIKLLDVQCKCVFTNTTPTAPYRGAGRPEASYCLERVVDEAATDQRHRPGQAAQAEPDLARRRCRTRRRSARPMTAATSRPLSRRAWRWPTMTGFKARAEESKKKGLLRGLGVCFVLEHAGGSPTEGTKVSFPGGDKMTFTMNVQSTGQSHATIFPRLVAERLGIKAEQIGHAHGDSAHEMAGYASVGSRTAMTAGHAMVKTLEALIAKGTKIAATALEAGEGDIEYKNGAFNVVGTDRRMSLFDVAARAKEMKKRGEITEDLDTKVVTDTPLTFPNGCHIAEVEVDPQTGLSTLASYSALDDSGNILDHPCVARPSAWLCRDGRRTGDAGADRL